MNLVNTPFYKRFAQVNIGGRKFESPPFTIEFKTDFKSVAIPPTTTLKLYNPSDDTIKVAEPTKNNRPPVIISAGYRTDFGTAVTGEVFEIKVKESRVDRILQLKIGDRTRLWTESIVSRTYKPGTSASFIILDTLARVGITPGLVIPSSDVRFKRGISFHAPLKNVLSQLAVATDSEIFFRNGQLNFQPINGGNRVNAIILSPETGLLNRPERIKNGFKVKSLFNYRIGPGQFIRLISKETAGLLKVYKGNQQFSTRGKAISSFEARLVA